jgi:hypothetical protein
MKALIDCTEEEIATLKGPYQRQVMMLRLKGLERWRIAEQLGRTEDSVKRAVTQARIALGLIERAKPRTGEARPWLQSQVVMLRNFGHSTKATARLVGRCENTVLEALKCAERAAGCRLYDRQRPAPDVPAEGAPKFQALATAARCACGLLLPCEACPVALGAVGYLRRGGGNLAELIENGPDSGGTGTHQGRRRAAA